MTSPSPTRRERLRSAAVAEIKQAARRLLVAGGPGTISLRAIARDMGMTAPAIYNYFPSLDALVIELTSDLYNELREDVEAARDTLPNDQPLFQLSAMARAFRTWSLAHPAEFGLMFGVPIPGVSAFEEACRDLEHAGALFGQSFLRVFDRLWSEIPPPPPPEYLEGVDLEPILGPYREVHADQTPPHLVQFFLDAWIRLYGLVSMEVFGHLRWAVTDVEPLFEAALADFTASVVAAVSAPVR
jgi:AcrR family transcriptional regulator